MQQSETLYMSEITLCAGVTVGRADCDPWNLRRSTASAQASRLVILSADAILGNSDDVSLGSFTRNGALASGRSYTRSADVTRSAAAPAAGITISSMCSGSQITSDASTSATVSGWSRKIALGFALALRR